MSATPSSSARILRRHPAVWWSRMKWRWPVLFWLAAAGGAAFFYFHGASTSAILGYVEVIEHQIGPLEDGRLRSLDLRVGDTVNAGDLLAVMDDSLLVAELAVERSYLAEAQGLVPEAVQFRFQVDRQYASALNSAEKDLQELMFLQSSAQAELQALSNELARLEKLLAARLIPASDLTDLRTREVVLRQQVADYPVQVGRRSAVVADWRRQYEQARLDVEGAAGDRMKDGNRLKSFTVEAHQNQIRLLELRRAATQIVAPVSGTLSAVNRRSGEVVSAGDVLIQLVETHSDRVVGFLPETAETALQVGDRVGVYSMYTTRLVGSATLISIGPAIRALPGRVSPVSTRTLRGRALYFRLDPGPDLAPGETVELQINEPSIEILRRWFARFRTGSPS